VKKAGVKMLLISAMALAQPLAFEVASIRPAPTQRPLPVGGYFCPFGCFNDGDLKIEGSRVDIAFMPLDALIPRAYRIRRDQLIGPDWMSVQRFDILATTPEGAAGAQVPEMLQALLAERFKLTAHRETREQPVYELRVDKNGPKLKESAESASVGGPSDRTVNSPQGPIGVRQFDDGVMVTSSPWGPMQMHFSAPGSNKPEMELLKVTMPMLADALTQFMDRPVIDATNLKGAYQVALSMQDMRAFLQPKFVRVKGVRPSDAPDPQKNSSNPAAASDPTGSSTIFKTMEKLGLKLERTKAPIEMLVVDHLEKSPTEN
jgi:uncharacterized protein (TIGR03435 family)